MRDENGFKCHTQSESHVRQMLLVGEDPKKYIQAYSNEFINDFLKQLKTSHGEKQININHFYQEYIANKEHVHMNATKWSSLTEFAKHLGREGLCRVEETEKGLFVSWIDNSPEALRRQDALRKKERQDRNDEQTEQRLIEQQVRRAQRDKEAARAGGNNNKEEGVLGENASDADASKQELQRAEGEKIKLSFGSKVGSGDRKKSSSPSGAATPVAGKSSTQEDTADGNKVSAPATPDLSDTTTPAPPKENAKVAMKLGGASSKPKNVFAAASKKNGLARKKVEAPKQLSATERIIKEDMERKRPGSQTGIGFNIKRQRIS